MNRQTLHDAPKNPSHIVIPKLRLLRLAVAWLLIHAVDCAERPFSDELAPYPSQPSAVAASVDEIHARTVTAANQVGADSTACRKSAIAMYRSLGIDPSADRSTLRRLLPKTWSRQTPQPLQGEFLQPFSIDSPFYHAIPATSPRVLLPAAYIGSFHVATVGKGGDGWGIGVVIGLANDPVKRLVQTWDRDDPRPGDHELSLRIPVNVQDFIPRNTGDRHLCLIDGTALVMANTWHFAVHGDLFTGLRAYGPHQLGSLGVGEGTNAAQISDLVGLLRAGEASDPTKPIPHALFGPSRKYWKAIVYPAINWDEWVGRSDGGNGVVPYGGVIQLDPAIDLAALPLSLPARRILEAVQHYGWYLHDTGVRDMDVWSSATGEELGGKIDNEVKEVLTRSRLYLVPAPAKYQAPYPPPRPGSGRHRRMSPRSRARRVLPPRPQPWRRHGGN